MKNPYRRNTIPKGMDEKTTKKLDNTLHSVLSTINSINPLGFEKLRKFKTSQPDSYDKLMEKCAVKIASKYLLKTNSNNDFLEYKIMFGTYVLMIKKIETYA